MAQAPSTLPIDPDNFGNLLLQGLHEISLPESVAYIPVTLGWQLMGLALFVATAYWVYRRYCRWQRNAYRRRAIAQVQQVMAQGLAPDDRLLLLTTLLKAAAIQAYPRTVVASLSGQAWLNFLQQQTPRAVFADASSQRLIVEQYQPNKHQLTASDCEQFAYQITQWLTYHQAYAATPASEPQHV